MDHNIVSMTWEIGVLWPAQAINLAHCIDTLYTHFILNQRRSPDSIGDQNAFIATLLQIVDRTPVKVGDEGLQEVLKVRVSEEGSKKIVDDVAKELYEDIEDDLRSCYGKTLELSVLGSNEVDGLALAMMDESVESGGLGPNLDAGVYTMLLTKRKVRIWGLTSQ